VTYWFEEDRQDQNSKALADDEKLTIDLQKLKEFVGLLSNDARFYYGHDPKTGSLGFISAARHIFGGNRVFTKPTQKVRHHLSADESGWISNIAEPRHMRRRRRKPACRAGPTDLAILALTIKLFYHDTFLFISCLLSF
jgi:hypothetical protein